MKSNQTSTALNESQTRGLAATKLYFESMQNRDIATVEGLFTDDVVEIIPLSGTGDPTPGAVFEGKEQVMGYQHLILKNFSQIRFINPVYTASGDGSAVFFEAHGDLIETQSGKPYNNVYIFKFTLRAGLIAHIAEYANPVTFNKLMGLPIG